MNPIDLINRRGAAGALLGAILAIEAGCATHNQDSAANDRASMATCPGSEIAPGAEPTPATLPLGCANRANLRAMVANSADLEQGQALEPASGAQEARAIEAYKKGAVKKLGTESGTGSTMGAQATPQTQ